jgi:hypothetical protein
MHTKGSMPDRITTVKARHIPAVDAGAQSSRSMSFRHVHATMIRGTRSIAPHILPTSSNCAWPPCPGTHVYAITSWKPDLLVRQLAPYICKPHCRCHSARCCTGQAPSRTHHMPSTAAMGLAPSAPSALTLAWAPGPGALGLAPSALILAWPPGPPAPPVP